MWNVKISTWLLVIGMWGCSGAVCPVQRFPTSPDALRAYRDMRAPARVLRAEARVDRRDSQGRIRGTVLMFIERPDHVRFDAMTQFGPVAVLTSDGQAFALTDLRENQFLTGQTCPANIERLLGLRFSAEEVTRLLLGDTPLVEGEDEPLMCHSGAYRVIRRATDGQWQELDFQVHHADVNASAVEQRLRLVRSELFDAAGQTVWRVSYDDYRFVTDPRDTSGGGRGVAMPFRVRFEEPMRDVDTLVRFREIDLNPEVPEGAFVQRPRPGLATHIVGCE